MYKYVQYVKTDQPEYIEKLYNIIKCVVSEKS